MKKGFTLLETIGRRQKAMVSLTGFSLIEVLLAIFILGLGIVTLFNLFPLGLQSFSYARKLNAVYFLAEKKLEELKLEQSLETLHISCWKKDLRWKISAAPLKLPGGMEVIYAELEIDFTFQAK